MTRNGCIVALVLLGLATSCKTAEEGVVGKPPEEAEQVAARPTRIEGEKKAEAPRQTYPEPLLAVEAWPFQEERRTFELTWNGGQTRLPLHAEADPNSELLGDVGWKNGERIRWQGSVVAVYQPATYRATEEWQAEGPVFTTGYLTGDDFVNETIRKGQGVDVYLYAGGGQCFLGVGQKIFTGACPPKASFQGPFQGPDAASWYQPVQRVWWIQVADGLNTGWVPVDNRIVVDIVDA